MQNKYSILITEHETSLKRQTVIFNLVGYIKLFLVLIIGVLLFFIFSKDFPIGIIIANVIMLGGLTVLWIYHNGLYDRINYDKGVIAINKRHLDRVSGEWTHFNDIGEEFVDTEHAYACDLDIVGKKSLFQFLNTTNTWHGRQAFANDLLQGSYTDDEIRKRQEAVVELSKDIEFSNNIQYYLSKIGAYSSATELVSELKNKLPFTKHKAIKVFLTFLPLVSVIFIAGIIAFQLRYLYLVGAILALFQAVLWVIGIPKTQRYLGIMARLPYKLSAYNAVIELLKKREFHSDKLVQIQEQVNVAAQAIKDLSKISDKVSVRHNGIIYFIVNVLFLWDYECAFVFEEWKEKYAHLSEKWFLSLGEFESLLCFSHLPNICSETCMPTIIDTRKMYDAKSMGHPLLSNKIRVVNDIKCDNNIFIISGSNMSGKTTLLRTVGINLVLARAGGYACAKQFSCSLLRVITSMRIADDLNEGISTFYAELRRIKTIIDFAKENPDMIFLIDEIFRGTNSADRLSGAKTVIEKLNELGIIGIISTHDLELCELATKYPRIMNCSFSEQYINNTISFDYKIKTGKSRTTNAKYLMEMIGIL